MKDKTFRRILWITLAVLVILTAVHMAYVINAYQNSSIIYFVSKELW